MLGGRRRSGRRRRGSDWVVRIYEGLEGINWVGLGQREVFLRG